MRLIFHVSISDVNGRSEGMGKCGKVKISLSKPRLERFSSTISSFKCELCGKNLIAWNSYAEANMQGNFK